ncbi:hypothetical protein BDV19DRAFT_357380 [Aspergillus venezuelensis]
MAWYANTPKLMSIRRPSPRSISNSKYALCTMYYALASTCTANQTRQLLGGLKDRLRRFGTSVTSTAPAQQITAISARGVVD